MYSVETPIAVPTSSDSSRAAREREHVQQFSGLGHHDRDPLPRGVQLHLGQHRIGLGPEVRQVAVDCLGDDHRGHHSPERAISLVGSAGVIR